MEMANRTLPLVALPQIRSHAPWHLPPDVFNRLLHVPFAPSNRSTFCVVREPSGRFASEMAYRVKQASPHLPVLNSPQLEYRAQTLMAGRQHAHFSAENAHWMPQSWFVWDGDGGVQCHCVVAFERLPQLLSGGAPGGNQTEAHHANRASSTHENGSIPSPRLLAPGAAPSVMPAILGKLYAADRQLWLAARDSPTFCFEPSPQRDAEDGVSRQRVEGEGGASAPMLVAEAEQAAAAAAAMDASATSRPKEHGPKAAFLTVGNRVVDFHRSMILFHSIGVHLSVQPHVDFVYLDFGQTNASVPPNLAAYVKARLVRLRRAPPVTQADVRHSLSFVHAIHSGLVMFNKLEAWSLTTYAVVVFLDSDMLARGDLSGLLRLGSTGGNLSHADGPESPLNGGLLVLRPDEAVYQQMVAVARRANFSRDPLRGWEGAGIQRDERNQVAAEQGFLYYYWHKRQPFDGTLLDRSVYNLACCDAAGLRRLEVQDRTAGQVRLSGARLVHFASGCRAKKQARVNLTSSIPHFSLSYIPEMLPQQPCLQWREEWIGHARALGYS